MGLIRKQVILVGDSGCGKSALALRLTHALFAESYIPTAFESLTTDIETSHGNTKLTIQDISGAKERKEVRKLAYEGCDMVLLCFDLTDRSTYESVETRWVPEITSVSPGIPVFIAGCKSDAVEDVEVVTEQQIEELVVKIGAAGYMKCSALTNENVERIFQDSLEAKVPKQKTNIKKVIDTVKTTKKTIRRMYSNI